METHQKIKSVLSVGKVIALQSSHFKSKIPVFGFNGSNNNHSYNKRHHAEKPLATLLVFWCGER